MIAALLLAATALTELRGVPDTTATLGATTVGDEGVAADSLTGPVTLVSVGGIPPETAIDAYALTPDGRQLLSFETTVILSNGSTALPGDVWAFDGAGYAAVFEAAPRGIPPTANLDAVTLYAGSLLMSFDTAFHVGGTHFEPADLIRYDGASFSMFFDGSAAGVSPGLDLDAADYLACNGHLLLSFDGSGSIGGVAFDDEDVLEFDRAAAWQMAYDGTAEHAAWGAADLAGAAATVNLGPGAPLTFGQTVTVDANKTTFRWPSSADFRQVRGTFASSASLGAYAVSSTILGTGTSFIDASIPGTGTGYWYLVKRGGCAQTTWQSAVGLESGRDAAIP